MTIIKTEDNKVYAGFDLGDESMTQAIVDLLISHHGRTEVYMYTMIGIGRSLGHSDKEIFDNEFMRDKTDLQKKIEDDLMALYQSGYIKNPMILRAIEDFIAGMARAATKWPYTDEFDI